MMDRDETERLVETLQRQRPHIKAQPWRNDMTQTYEVAVNGGDPRGIRLWLKTPRQVLRYITWLAAAAPTVEGGDDLPDDFGVVLTDNGRGEVEEMATGDDDPSDECERMRDD